MAGLVAVPQVPAASGDGHLILPLVRTPTGRIEQCGGFGRDRVEGLEYPQEGSRRRRDRNRSLDRGGCVGGTAPTHRLGIGYSDPVGPRVRGSIESASAYRHPNHHPANRPASKRHANANSNTNPNCYPIPDRDPDANSDAVAIADA